MGNVLVVTPFVVEEHEGFLVVRDDLVDGGTKARVLPRALPEGFDEYVYPSPAFGYAQVALAAVARDAGVKATVFVAKRKQQHPLTQLAKSYGARIVEVPHGYLSVVKKRARDYCEGAGRCLMPWGLDYDEFRGAFLEVLLEADLPGTHEVWCVVGSGVLARTLRAKYPFSKLCVVRTGAKSADLSFADEVYDAPEKYERPAKVPPPFPSCTNYDAKAWRFIKEHGTPGALFWNVAK